jgi:hypothetical protein
MNDNLEDKIFDAIKSGDLKMRPRWYFILRDVLGVIAIVIVLLVVVYLASFIIFVLHQSGAWFVPVFGLSGWFALFSALPWLLVLLSAIFVIVLAILVKRYQFSYQWPMLYSFLGVVFLIAAACFLFIESSFYNQFFSSSIAEDVPFLGMYYPGFGTLGPNDVHRGIIASTNPDGFVLEDNGGGTSTIFIATSTIVPLGPGFQQGDMIVVFGDRSTTGTIFAAGVERLK